jgi:aspartyl-tRNA(Asn)/glutamyl-tRNA(Gln) amidotransferase subunit A
MKRYLIDANTVIANLIGIPAISIPTGFNDKLPIGVQLMADEMQDQLLLSVSKIYERIAGVRRKPDFI